MIDEEIARYYALKLPKRMFGPMGEDCRRGFFLNRKKSHRWGYIPFSFWLWTGFGINGFSREEGKGKPDSIYPVDHRRTYGGGWIKY